MKNFGKVIGMVFVCLFLVFAFVSCYRDAGDISGDIKTPPGSDALAPAPAASKTIFLVSLQYPPYEYEENGEIKGIAVDLVTEAFKRMGYQVRIEINPWSRSQAMVRNGTADGIFTIYKTPERETFVDYSKQVVMPQVVSLFTLKDSSITFDGDLSKLKKHAIGTVRGVSYGNKFDNAVKAQKIHIEETETGELNMQKLLSKRIDVLASNKYGALHILKQMKKTAEVKELTPEVESVPSYIAFSKKRSLTNIRDEFDKVFAEMKNDGTYDRIIENFTQSLY